MKTLWINFKIMLKQFKTATILNILVLAAAFAIAVIVTIQLNYDLSFNRSFPNYKKIFTPYATFDAGSYTSPYIPGHIAHNMREQIPEVQGACLFLNAQDDIFTTVLSDGSESSQRMSRTMVNGDFIDMFSAEIVNGSSESTLSAEGYAIISESHAKALFGNEDPIGKTVLNKSESGTATFIIEGVYRDFAENTSLRNGLYMFMVPDLFNYSLKAYFLFEPEDRETIISKIYSPVIIPERLYKAYTEAPENMVFSMEPISDVHFFARNNVVEGRENANTSITIAVFGVLVLIIAFVSFINITIAMVPSRVKQINLQKILGANLGKLRMALASQAMVMALLAFLLSLLFVNWFSTTTFTTFFNSELKISNNIGVVVITGIVLLFVAFLIGMSTARYSTSFDESLTLKGSYALTPRGAKIRNVFITVQFIAAITLISVSAFIKIHHDHMRNASWGFKSENIIYARTSFARDSQEAFAEELMRDPHFVSYSKGGQIPGTIYAGFQTVLQGEELKNMGVWIVSSDFFDMMGIKIRAGRNFTQTDDKRGMNEVIVNPQFLYEYGLDESILGQQIKNPMADEMLTIVGISDDIYFMPLNEPLRPLMFFSPQLTRLLGITFFKITGDDIPGMEKHMKEVWSKFSERELRFGFIEEHLQSFYSKEEGMAQLIGLISIMIIFIAVIGVYGMIIFTARYKKKEIAIRKVNGSSIREVVLMLNKATLIMLGIAFVIGCIAATLAIDKWLENYAAKIDIPWWLYPAVGLLMFIITAGAVSWQSYKAAAANPVESLKHE